MRGQVFQTAEQRICTMKKQEVLERIGVLEKSLDKTNGSEHHLSDILERQGLYIILDYLEWREANSCMQVQRTTGRSRTYK